MIKIPTAMRMDAGSVATDASCVKVPFCVTAQIPTPNITLPTIYCNKKDISLSVYIQVERWLTNEALFH